MRLIMFSKVSQFELLWAIVSNWEQLGAIGSDRRVNINIEAARLADDQILTNMYWMLVLALHIFIRLESDVKRM